MNKIILKHNIIIQWIIIGIISYFITKNIIFPIWIIGTYIILEYKNWIEKIILNNLSILIIFISIFLIIYKDNLDDNITLISFLWWIILFWYWYKKYERDKELEMIDKLSNEYNKIKEKKDNKKLIDFWYKEFYFYKNWYIAEERWDYIELRIIKNIINSNEELRFILSEYISKYSTFFWKKDNNMLEFKELLIKKFQITLNNINEGFNVIENWKKEFNETVDIVKKIDPDNIKNDEKIKKYEKFIEENNKKLTKHKKNIEELLFLLNK